MHSVASRFGLVHLSKTTAATNYYYNSPALSPKEDYSIKCLLKLCYKVVIYLYGHSEGCSL